MYPDSETVSTAEWLAPGSEWVLFAQGVRVGRLTASATGLAEDFCVPRPTISGRVELVPNAVSAELLMALPAYAASERTYDPLSGPPSRLRSAGRLPESRFGRHSPPGRGMAP